MSYPPIVISAVAHSTGLFTSVGHGLVTGGGFVAFPRGPLYGGVLYAPTGGVIPTGLAPVTTYWPIRVDADHFKLATSSANAMAGTAVAFSTDGTLPLSFLVGIPFEVPRVSAIGTQVFSDDDNTTWQALKALWNLLTGQAESIWNGNVSLAGTLYAADLKHGSQTETICATAGTALEAHWVNDPSTGAFKKSVGSGMLTVSIPVKVGDRITGLTFQLFGNASADVTAVVEYIDVTMAPVQVGSLTVNNEPAAWSTKTVTIASPHKMVAVESAHVTFFSSASGLQLGNINYTRDRPLL